MTNQVIKHEIKLEKSVKLILVVFAFGILAHAFNPSVSFGIKEAMAELSGGDAVDPFVMKLNVNCTGCN